MIAVDTSTLIAFIQGETGPDIELLDANLTSAEAALPPVVVTEVLSEPRLPQRHRAIVLRLPKIDLSEGYWVRAATTRSAILGHKLRARLADALIAQSCLDADIALITRDRDFRHFAKHCGLRLA